jgi:hypothetical protein
MSLHASVLRGAAASVHRAVFGEAVQLIDAEGVTTPVVGVVGRSRVMERLVGGHTQNVIVLPVRIPGGERPDADTLVEVRGDRFTIESSSPHIGGIVLNLVRTLSVEVARDGYRRRDEYRR